MKLVLLIGDSKCDCPQKVAFIFSACNVRPTTGKRKKRFANFAKLQPGKARKKS